MSQKFFILIFHISIDMFGAEMKKKNGKKKCLKLYSEWEATVYCLPDFFFYIATQHLKIL